MAAKSRKKFDRSKGILVMVVGILLLVIVALITTYPHAKTTIAVSNASDGVHVNLGPLAYRIVDNRAVRRTDASATELASFLQALGQKDVADPTHCSSVYYDVMVAATDEKQVLLNYGCGSPNARMFAVKQNGAWKALSQTNQFDIFGVPSCDYVNSNKIDKTIAPVCQSGSGKADVTVTYSVRD